MQNRALAINALVAAILVVATRPAAAGPIEPGPPTPTVINFDDVPGPGNGYYIGNFYAASGAIVSAKILTWPEAHSSPNVAAVFGEFSQDAMFVYFLSDQSSVSLYGGTSTPAQGCQGKLTAYDVPAAPAPLPVSRGLHRQEISLFSNPCSISRCASPRSFPSAGSPLPAELVRLTIRAMSSWNQSTSCTRLAQVRHSARRRLRRSRTTLPLRRPNSGLPGRPGGESPTTSTETKPTSPRMLHARVQWDARG